MTNKKTKKTYIYCHLGPKRQFIRRLGPFTPLRGALWSLLGVMYDNQARNASSRAPFGVVGCYGGGVGCVWARRRALQQ
jgi:hypothetical protein